MLILQDISYAHPNKDLLFDKLNFTLNQYDKSALIGNNGAGKSTLLRIISGELAPSEGNISLRSIPYYVPQAFGQFNHLTIAQALQIDQKLHALKEILGGNTGEENYHLLNDDWSIEDRCKEAFDFWKLGELDLSQKMETLSGGQKTKVFLAGIYIHDADLILLDEPSNHLDADGRSILYDFIITTKKTMLVVSHDRKLLHILDKICELSPCGIKTYGGNYEFYKAQKELESDALSADIQATAKALKKAKEIERETLERQQKLNNRGKGKQEKAGVARIMMNTLRNKAENSSSKVKSVHAEKIGGISQELQTLRSALPDIDKMKFGFENAALHKGKILFRATNIKFSYQTAQLWNEALSLEISSGERIALKGKNGSGKTSLINIILGKLTPQFGTVYRASHKAIYVDQDYSLIENMLTVYEQAQKFNTSSLPEHDIRIRLSRFLFSREDCDKMCGMLSGGERMRLMLCCLNIQNIAPDIIILDEPTNNIDLQNIEILTMAINDYEGTLMVVSHDDSFLEQVNIRRIITL